MTNATACTYPACRCIVSTSTSQPEPVCPLGLENGDDVAPTTAVLDAITRRWTAFKSFAELVDWPDRLYRPTLRRDLGAHYVVLADAYDAAQAERGDPRRAYRG